MGWLPMSVEPMDGQRVLIACDDGVKEAEYWAKNARGHRGAAFFEAPYYGQDLSYHFKGVRKWMPMPQDDGN